MRKHHRVYDIDGEDIPPMTIAVMRTQSVHSLWATCTSPGCGHEAKLSADGFPDDMPVPYVALKLRCSSCGERQISTMPD